MKADESRAVRRGMLRFHLKQIQENRCGMGMSLRSQTQAYERPLWNDNWKQEESHNKLFCARAKEEFCERNSCSGKIDAKRKFSDTFIRRIQSRDFQSVRSMNEILFLFANLKS